jgi:hypothetical protein
MALLKHNLGTGYSPKATVIAKQIATYRKMSADTYARRCQMETDIDAMAVKTKLTKAKMEFLKSLRFLHSADSVAEMRQLESKYAQILHGHELIESIFSDAFDDVYEDVDGVTEDQVTSIIHEALNSAAPKPSAKEPSRRRQEDESNPQLVLKTFCADDQGSAKQTIISIPTLEISVDMLQA